MTLWIGYADFMKYSCSYLHEETLLVLIIYWLLQLHSSCGVYSYSYEWLLEWTSKEAVFRCESIVPDFGWRDRKSYQHCSLRLRFCVSFTIHLWGSICSSVIAVLSFHSKTELKLKVNALTNHNALVKIHECWQTPCPCCSPSISKCRFWWWMYQETHSRVEKTLEQCWWIE